MPDPYETTVAKSELKRDAAMDKVVGKALKRRKRKKPRGRYSKVAALIPTVTGRPPTVLTNAQYGADAWGGTPPAAADSSNGWEDTKSTKVTHTKYSSLQKEAKFGAMLKALMRRLGRAKPKSSGFGDRYVPGRGVPAEQTLGYRTTPTRPPRPEPWGPDPMSGVKPGPVSPEGVIFKNNPFVHPPSSNMPRPVGSIGPRGRTRGQSPWSWWERILKKRKEGLTDKPSGEYSKLLGTPQTTQLGIGDMAGRAAGAVKGTAKNPAVQMGAGGAAAAGTAAALSDGGIRGMLAQHAPGASIMQLLQQLFASKAQGAQGGQSRIIGPGGQRLNKDQALQQLEPWFQKNPQYRPGGQGGGTINRVGEGTMNWLHGAMNPSGVGPSLPGSIWESVTRKAEGAPMGKQSSDRWLGIQKNAFLGTMLSNLNGVGNAALPLMSPGLGLMRMGAEKGGPMMSPLGGLFSRGRKQAPQPQTQPGQSRIIGPGGQRLNKDQALQQLEPWFQKNPQYRPGGQGGGLYSGPRRGKPMAQPPQSGLPLQQYTGGVPGLTDMLRLLSEGKYPVVPQAALDKQSSDKYAALQKQAGQGTEIAGSLLNPLNLLGGNLGGLIAANLSKRQPLEQIAERDARGTMWQDLLIPGMAPYRNTMRNRLSEPYRYPGYKGYSPEYDKLRAGAEADVAEEKAQKKREKAESKEKEAALQKQALLPGPTALLGAGIGGLGGAAWGAMNPKEDEYGRKQRLMTALKRGLLGAAGGGAAGLGIGAAMDHRPASDPHSTQALVGGLMNQGSEAASGGYEKLKQLFDDAVSQYQDTGPAAQYLAGE